jgi:hypothetical protein
MVLGCRVFVVSVKVVVQGLRFSIVVQLLRGFFYGLGFRVLELRFKVLLLGFKVFVVAFIVVV